MLGQRETMFCLSCYGRAGCLTLTTRIAAAAALASRLEARTDSGGQTGHSHRTLRPHGARHDGTADDLPSIGKARSKNKAWKHAGASESSVAYPATQRAQSTAATAHSSSHRALAAHMKGQPSLRSPGKTTRGATCQTQPRLKPSSTIGAPAARGPSRVPDDAFPAALAASCTPTTGSGMGSSSSHRAHAQLSPSMACLQIAGLSIQEPGHAHTCIETPTTSGAGRLSVDHPHTAQRNKRAASIGERSSFDSRDPVSLIYRSTMHPVVPRLDLDAMQRSVSRFRSTKGGKSHVMKYAGVPRGDGGNSSARSCIHAGSCSTCNSCSSASLCHEHGTQLDGPTAGPCSSYFAQGLQVRGGGSQELVSSSCMHSDLPVVPSDAAVSAMQKGASSDSIKADTPRPVHAGTPAVLEAAPRRGRSRVTSADGWLEFGGELKRTFSGSAGSGGGRSSTQRRGATSYEVPKGGQPRLQPESEEGYGEHGALARSLEAITGQ